MRLRQQEAEKQRKMETALKRGMEGERDEKEGAVEKQT